MNAQTQAASLFKHPMLTVTVKCIRGDYKSYQQWGNDAPISLRLHF
jgi:hypothetical protein